MDSWLVCPTQIVPGLKLLLTVGVWIPVTFRVALAGVVFVILPPPPVAVSPPAGIVLIKLPGVVEVTSIETVQEPGVTPLWAATVPPVNDNEVPPAGAITVPPQVLVRLTGFAIEMPGWIPIRLSAHAAFVSWKVFGL